MKAYGGQIYQVCESMQVSGTTGSLFDYFSHFVAGRPHRACGRIFSRNQGFGDKDFILAESVK
jgi:hypothetical protein